MMTTQHQPETQLKEHWDGLHASKGAQAVSWYQPHAERSLRMIRHSGIGKNGAIIDVGGGESTLVDDLLAEGYSDVTVLDISAVALAAAARRLGKSASRVKWIEADITAVELPENAFDLWHDRAVFHFLMSAQSRAAYVAAVLRSLKSGGHLIVATFGETGPEQCSGLPVRRYRPDELHTEFGEAFTLLEHQTEEHRTPRGSVQQFVYCYLRKRAVGQEKHGDAAASAAP